MSERTKIAVVAEIDIVGICLAVFAFVTAGVIELLDFVVGSIAGLFASLS
jgi:hypothetical protein